MELCRRRSARVGRARAARARRTSLARKDRRPPDACSNARGGLAVPPRVPPVRPCASAEERGAEGVEADAADIERPLVERLHVPVGAVPLLDRVPDLLPDPL